MRRIFLGLIKVAVSAALLYLAIGKVDFAALAARFTPASIGWIALAVAVSISQIAVAGFRWHLLSGFCDAPLSFARAFRFVLIGTFFNQTLPSAIGGDGVRAWLVARHAGWRAATYSVFIDRAIGLVGLAALISMCLPWSFHELHNEHTRIGLLFADAIAVAGIIGFLCFAAIPSRWSDRWSPARHIRECAVIGWRSLTHPRYGIWIWILSILIHILSATISWCAANALGVSVSFYLLLLLVPPVSLITLLPISIAGWGLRETTLGVGFASVGLVTADGVAVSLVYGATGFLIGGLGGLIWILSAEKAEQGSQAIDVPAIGT